MTAKSIRYRSRRFERSGGDVSCSRAWNQKMEKKYSTYLTIIDWKRVLGLLQLSCNSFTFVTESRRTLGASLSALSGS